MSEKIQTARYTIREAHSLLILIAHSQLGGVVASNGGVVIDGAVIQVALGTVCKMLNEADDALDTFELEAFRAARKEGVA